MTESELLAHGVGGRQDLPIPFSYAIVGAAVAVTASFVAMILLWKRSRLRGDQAGRPIPTSLERIADSRSTRVALRVVGLAVTGFVAVAALFGPQDPTNPAPGFVYVWFWVGLVPASLLVGPAWRLLNPLRTIHRAVAVVGRIDPARGVRRYPRGLGYWPAAVGLFGFTWMELVAPGGADPETLVWWFAGYAVIHVLGAVVFGAGWFDRADTFEVYSSLIGRLSPLGRRADGRLVLRNPLDGLDGLTAVPGLVALVSVLLGSTAYDGFSNATFWVRTVQTSDLSPSLLGSLGLGSAVLLVAGTYLAGVALSGLAGSLGQARLPSAFVHSLIPIAVGYLVAHYFSLLVFEGQHTLILASDPLGTGADLFGTGDRQIDFTLVGPTAIAVVQVLAVVGGHVVGVFSAHDRAVRVFPPRRAVTGQLPLLDLMIAYTVGGLVLLFAA